MRKLGALRTESRRPAPHDKVFALVRIRPELISASIDFLRSIAAFIVVLGVLVFIHELGHYLAARWRGVFVETFSIGFGRPIATWQDRRGTLWKLAWIPLGGYVKLHGQERPQDVPPEVRARWIPGRTFQEKSVLSRAIVVAAGPAANFLLTMVLFAGLIAVHGRPVMKDGHPVLLPVVNQVQPGSGAARAGILAGDRIETINGQSVSDFEDLQRIIVANPNAQLRILLKRGSEEIAVTASTAAREENGKRIGLLGVQSGDVTYEHVSLPAALWGGVTETWRVTAETARGVAQIFSSGHGAGDIGGPIRIAQLSGEVAALGLASLVSFIAVLSVNLGLINLFPIPILDGGHLLFFLCEAIRGRPLPPRAQEYGFRAGLAVLAGLFIFATWNDLSHLIPFHF